jgi:CO dehydrogenase nickel-insertion accessory protein CooC1
VVASGRHDPLSDSYRTVRNVVGFVMGAPASTGQTTLVVSPGPGDGKTSLAANLAASMAETGKRTVLINTDFRRPRLASVLGPAATVPLPFTLEDLERLDARSMLNKTDRDNLLLMDLSTIDGSPGELLRATIDKLPELREMADAIVIDTSPVGVTAEALDLVPHADAIVVIARVGGTQIAMAQRTIAILRDLATAPMLLVLSGLKMEKADYYEYTDRKRRRRPIRTSGRSRRSESSDVAPPKFAVVEAPVDVTEVTNREQPTNTVPAVDPTGLFDTEDLFDADDLFQFDDEIRARSSTTSGDPSGVPASDVKPSE